MSELLGHLYDVLNVAALAVGYVVLVAIAWFVMWAAGVRVILGVVALAEWSRRKGRR
jgi:hypothetical protein